MIKDYDFSEVSAKGGLIRLSPKFRFAQLMVDLIEQVHVWAQRKR